MVLKPSVFWIKQACLKRAHLRAIKYPIKFVKKPCHNKFVKCSSVFPLSTLPSQVAPMVVAESSALDYDPHAALFETPYLHSLSSSSKTVVVRFAEPPPKHRRSPSPSSVPVFFTRSGRRSAPLTFDAGGSQSVSDGLRSRRKTRSSSPSGNQLLEASGENPTRQEHLSPLNESLQLTKQDSSGSSGSDEARAPAAEPSIGKTRSSADSTDSEAFGGSRPSQPQELPAPIGLEEPPPPQRLPPFSSEVRQRVTAPQRPSTRSCYDAKWTIF